MMALQDFIIELIEGLLDCEDLKLDDKDVRFYEKGTTAADDECLDDHIKWKNARHYNTEQSPDCSIARERQCRVSQSFCGRSI